MALKEEDDPEPTWVAVPADVAVLLAARQEEAALQRRLLDLAEVRRRAPQVHNQLTDDLGAASWNGQEAVPIDGEAMDSVVQQFALSARSQVRRLEKVPGTPALAIAPEVRQWSLYERAVMDDPDLLAKIQLGVVRAQHDVRILPQLPLRMVVTDDDAAVVDLGKGAYVLQPSPLLTSFINLFDLLWERAIDPMSTHDVDGNPEWPVSEDDLALLRLLAAGLKDQAIARHLGIGLRTVVRRVGLLARSLDAETRFQVGLQAARRGLL